MSKLLLSFIAFSMLVPTFVLAQTHKGISFQALIRSPSGDLITKSGITVVAKILSPNNCVLREEEFTGVGVSAGYLNLNIGQGSTSGADPGLGLSSVFDNSASIGSLTCLNSDGSVNGSVSTFDPATGSGLRKLRISFTVDGLPVEADFNMRSVAYAINAETLDGKKSTDFLKITDSISDASISSLAFSKLTAVPSPLLQIAGLSCADGKIVKKVAGAWACADESGVGSESDPTVQNFAKAAPGLGLEVASNQLAVKMADIQSNASGNWAINVTGNAATATSATTATTATSAASFTGSLNGDVSGNQTSTSVDKIKGVSVSAAVAGDDSKFLKFTNGSGWAPQFVKLSELKNAAGTASAFNVGSCSASQTLVWSSITDQFSCQNISVTKSQISDFPTLSTVATSGSYADLSNKPTLASVASSGDYNDLLNKPTINSGTVTSVTATAGTPIVMSGTATAPTVGISAASSTTNGYLSSADWNTFNNKLSSINSSDVTTALGFTPQTQNSELTALGGIASTGILKRTGAASYSTLGLSAPISESGGNIGLSLSSTGGLYLNSGNLSIKLGSGLSVDGSNQLGVSFGTSAGTAAQGDDTRIVNAVQTSDARLPSSTCASGSFNRWNGSAWVCETDQNSGGSWSLNGVDAYYNAGKVGIGTNTPAAKLDVAGEVKFGNTSSTCDASNEGQQRYNSTAKLMEFCNGTTWTAYGATSAGSVVQMVVATTTTTATSAATSFTEVNSAYRISFTPKYSTSKVLIEYTFPMNTAMAGNTIFHMQMVRNIGGTETLVGVGPTNGSRDLVSYVARPGNGTDANDQLNVHMVATDSGLTAGTSYTYGFKFRRETGGSGSGYFLYSSGDSSVYGMSGVMTMKITEIAQ